ncbi:MAG: tyrosine-type recombinase/integrase [Thermodesulfobacteriota bacterium]
MSKRPSLVKQVVDQLQQQARYGQSKFEAKQLAIAQSRAAGAKQWQPARIDGIFSLETMASYRKQSIAFVQWAKQNHNCRWLAEARLFADQYLLHKLNQGHSAWTLQLTRAALRKLYQDPQLGCNVSLPIRHKDEIKRSRGPKLMDKKFSLTRNRDLVDFCCATGLRRHELRTLQVDDVYFADGRTWVFVAQGKGGRPRTVPVLQAMQERVKEIISTKRADEKVFLRIPIRADIHGYRRHYANALYQQLAGSHYDPHSKNKDAMLLVSAALGHNRLDVVTRNYLDPAA